MDPGLQHRAGLAPDRGLLHGQPDGRQTRDQAAGEGLARVQPAIVDLLDSTVGFEVISLVNRFKMVRKVVASTEEEKYADKWQKKLGFECWFCFSTKCYFQSSESYSPVT